MQAASQFFILQNAADQRHPYIITGRAELGEHGIQDHGAIIFSEFAHVPVKLILQGQFVHPQPLNLTVQAIQVFYLAFCHGHSKFIQSLVLQGPAGSPE